MRIRLGEVRSSEFVRSESDFEPSYILTGLKRKVHRVKVVGTVRSPPIFGSDNSYARFELDDSTGAIWVSAFHGRVGMVERIAQGDMVQIVATVNEYQGRLELIAECIWKVNPNFWLLHRAEAARSELEGKREYEKVKSIVMHERNILEAKETAREIGLEPEVIESVHAEIESGEAEEDIGAEVLGLISKLDAGSGVRVEDIVEGLKTSHSSDEVESALGRLLDDGEIYEPTVGKYSRI